MSVDRDSIDRFLEMMAAQAGAAANTLAAYRRDLTLASVELAGDLAAADAERIGRLADSWRDLATATVARKSAALRRFYGFLAEEGLRDDDPSAALPRPATRRALPRTLGHGDVAALFAALNTRLQRDPAIPADLRLAALIELLYGSGLRASELVSLPRHAIHPDRPFLILRGKGGPTHKELANLGVARISHGHQPWAAAMAWLTAQAAQVLGGAEPDY